MARRVECIQGKKIEILDIQLKIYKMKTNKIVYWISTGLLSLLLLFSASMYFMNTDGIREIFVGLGYNGRIVIPLGVLKILAVIAITSNKSKMLKEWAYFGLLIDFVLAFEAHTSAQDGEFGGALVALILWTVSYIFNKRIYA